MYEIYRVEVRRETEQVKSDEDKICAQAVF